MTHKNRLPDEFKHILEKAAEFHGHLGPFLTIGVKMGLIGLNRIGIDRGEALTIVASLPYRVPFSCIIDGIQVSTNCTVGNQRLSLNDSPRIQAVFKRKKNGQKVIVALNQVTFEKLKSQLLQNALQDEEVRELAWKVAEMPEGELFTVTWQTFKKKPAFP